MQPEQRPFNDINERDIVSVSNLHIAFDNTTILDNIDISIKPGEFVCLIGQSGCGKSTLLRAVGGLVDFSGNIRVDGSPPIDAYEKVAYVFQSARMLKWRSALDNVILATQLRRGGGRRRLLRQDAVSYLEMVELGHVKDRLAHKLSGGEQQRVSIARALSVHPQLLLMDEPFSALDVKTRATLRDQIIDIWRETGITVIFVTHSIEEAIYLGTRIIALKGRPSSVSADMQIDRPYPRDLKSVEAQDLYQTLGSILGSTELV